MYLDWVERRHTHQVKLYSWTAHVKLRSDNCPWMDGLRDLNSLFTYKLRKKFVSGCINKLKIHIFELDNKYLSSSWSSSEAYLHKSTNPYTRGSKLQPPSIDWYTEGCVNQSIRYSPLFRIQDKNDIRSSVHHFFCSHTSKGLRTKRQGCVTRFPGFCSFSSARAMPSLPYSTALDSFSVLISPSSSVVTWAVGVMENSLIHISTSLWSEALIYQCSINQQALIYTLLHIHSTSPSL